MTTDSHSLVTLDLTPGTDSRLAELNEIGFNHLIGLSLLRWTAVSYTHLTLPTILRV